MLLRATIGWLFVAASCSRAHPPAPPVPPPGATAATQSCLDAELARRGLNEYGDPPGTMYAGGTPLFDESTGKRTDREAYVFAQHPEIARACGK